MPSVEPVRHNPNPQVRIGERGHHLVRVRWRRELSVNDV